jgi:hypothetical protein
MEPFHPSRKTKKSKQFDAIIPDVGTIKGIYELNGDTIKRCNGKINGPRTRDFEAGIYSIWKRNKPQAGHKDVEPQKRVSCASSEESKQKASVEKRAVPN